jgi:transcriptional regulator PpsR
MRRLDEVADLSALSDLAPELAATLVSAVSDIALVLDSSGVIQSVSLSGAEPAMPATENWVGQKWIDTVTPHTRQKVEDLLREVAAKGVSRRRQVNHPSTSGLDIPIIYTAVRLGERGPVLALGRDLRAISAIQQRLVETQQAMERDYWQMRQAETRYRLLFQIATDAVLILDGATLRVSDANAAAGRVFGLPAEDVIGRSATLGFDRGAQAAVESALVAARVTGRPGEIRAQLRNQGGEARISVTPFRSEGATLLLMRVVGGESPDAAPNADAQLAALIATTPDAVVVTDLDGRVVRANPAFLDLAQLASEEQVRGRSLGDWIGRPGCDLAMILSILRKHDIVRLLATSARGEHGLTTEVELSATLLATGERKAVGFILRSVDRRLAAGPQGAHDLTSAVEQLTGLVGRVSLPDLVRDTTDLVERHFIRAALELTGDNRTNAAEVLGLSRQSLYVKLRRHQLQAEEGADEASTPPSAQ